MSRDSAMRRRLDWTFGTICLASALAGLAPAAAEERSWVSNAWSATTSATKKGWNTTVDIVTLKPVRRAMTKEQPSNIRLGSSNTYRKPPKPQQPGFFSSLFTSKKKSEPGTLEEFFSQERPRQ
jgi:hypothetical protein